MTNNNHMVFIGYIRVSTLKQVKGHSLKYQKEAMQAYAKNHNFTIETIYVDAGISGVKKRLKHTQTMDTALSQERISGVIVYTISRFGRSTQDLLFHIERLLEKKKKFVSVKEDFDASTKMGKLVLTILASVAEWDRENILEQLAVGREYAKEHGTKSGKPMHRPLKAIDWSKVSYYREHQVSWRRIASLVGVTTPTLIKRARAEGYSILTFDTVPMQTT